jgi:hypothetical protein
MSWPDARGLAAIAAATLLALMAPAPFALAASPGPSPDALGDPRSAGQGPGLVGDPLLAVVIVTVIGLLALGTTLAYVRLTAGSDGRR